MDYVQIEVARRDEKGSAAVRRLRRGGILPSVLYGMGRPNLDLSIQQSEFERFLRSGSHLVQLRMGEAVRSAILREVQVDPLTDEFLHADFTRVSDDVEIEDSCHIVFKGRAKGTGEGGLFQGLTETIQVKALPRNLPGEITIDISHLGVGDSVLAGDVPLGEGVELLTQPTETLCQVSAPKAVADVAEGEEGTGEGEAGETSEGGDEGAAPAES